MRSYPVDEVVPSVHPEEDAWRLCLYFAAIFFIDKGMQWAGWFPEPKSNTRYFSVHVVVNAFVTYVYAGQVWQVYQDPVNAYLGFCETRGVVAIFALHIYHIVMFRPLAMVDWVHHIVMIVVMLPGAYLLAPGYMLGHGAFFASGLPGGIDYAMLVAVKKGWMTSGQEKKYNGYIQLWIRMPGCVMHALLTWANWCEAAKRIYDPDDPYAGQGWLEPESTRLPVWIVATSFFWNGPYFLDRVLRSHERHLIREAKATKLLAKAK